LQIKTLVHQWKFVAGIEMSYIQEYEDLTGKRLKMSKQEIDAGLSREDVAKERILAINRNNGQKEETKEIYVKLQLKRRSNLPKNLSIVIDENFIDWFEALNERYDNKFDKVLEHALNFGIGHINDQLPNQEAVKKFLEQGKLIYQK